MGKSRLCAMAVLLSFCAMAAGPTDNLRTVYRNSAYTNRVDKEYTDFVPPTHNAVQLGPGSGMYWRTNGAKYVPNLRSTIGAPISTVSANKFLGEPLTPPENWDGKKPEISQNMGGMAVWVDFAKTVLTSQSGLIEVKWGLTNGTTRTETSVISASPKKRPVRLYWTHARPESPVSTNSSSLVFKPLQNAGPTVQFGSNYKVHLYPTSSVKILGDDGYYVDAEGNRQLYSPSDGNGYVHLNVSELQAIEGTSGTFLIVYSRLDEELNERVMLAYELVEVLEPMQTQINIGIGDQLRPLSRSFSTDELFPMVTRGMTDDADNGEIYVYQHGTGDQKNYLWAIRDSSENPWKIEVFWQAKEDLDIVWPFEVDIYSASWNDENAQEYLRDCDKDGKAQIHPKVYVPAALSVEAMDYQVVNYNKKKKSAQRIQKHVHVESGAFYTDYADDGTYALLKYTSGDTVWFQTVKSVPKKDATPYSPNGGTPLAEEIKPPTSYWLGQVAEGVEEGSAEDDRFFYPGWIHREFETDDPGKYPVKNAYHTGFYQYPTEWATTNELYSPIFPVNIGQLEVWWSKLSNLYGAIREGSGHTEEMKSQIFFPTKAYLYSIGAPIDRSDTDEPAAPQIVLASGKGSAGYAMKDLYMSQPSKGVRLDMDEGSADGTVKGYVVTTVPGSGTNEEFTVENWLSFQQQGGEWKDSAGNPLYNYKDVNPANGVPWLSFHGVDAAGNASASARLSLRVDMNANIWINGVKKTDFSEIPSPLFHKVAESSINPGSGNAQYQYQPRVFHVALAHSKDDEWHYYVNGMLVAAFAAAEGVAVKGGDELRFFPLSLVEMALLSLL